MSFNVPLSLSLFTMCAYWPEQVYGEMAGLTCCVFYYRDRLVELEPVRFSPLFSVIFNRKMPFPVHFNKK
jgi:hypothetical protein